MTAVINFVMEAIGRTTCSLREYSTALLFKSCTKTTFERKPPAAATTPAAVPAALFPWFAAGTTALAPAGAFAFLGATARFPCGAPAGAAFLSAVDLGAELLVDFAVCCFFFLVVVLLGFAACVDEVLLVVACCAFTQTGETASAKQTKLEIHAFCKGKASFKRIPSASSSIKTSQIIYLERLVNLKFYVKIPNIGFIPSLSLGLMLWKEQAQD